MNTTLYLASFNYCNKNNEWLASYIIYMAILDNNKVADLHQPVYLSYVYPHK